METCDIFLSFAQNIGGGSNEYQQSMFKSKNKKNDVYPLPVNPSFDSIKVGCKGM